MSFVNKYLRNFTPYKVASHKIWTVEPEQRKEILKLDWNEAEIQPSPKVGERLRALVADGTFYNLYPSTYNAELMALLSRYVGLPEENIQYFASSDSLHEYIAKLYITVGDPVLLLGPTYDNFRLTAEVCGANIFYYNIDETFQFDFGAFIARIDEIEPSLVYICNPNNPTGTLHEVRTIQMLLERYPQVLFLVDEAYAEFSGVSAKQLVLKYENILISRTMSKAFAQEAAIGALSDIPYMQRYVDEVRRAGEAFCRTLVPYGEYVRCVRGGGNFVLLAMEREQDKPELLAWLTEQNVFVRDVGQTEYLRRHCMRVTIGTEKKMVRVAAIICGYLDEKYGG